MSFFHLIIYLSQSQTVSKLHDVIRPVGMKTASMGFSFLILCLASSVEDSEAEETRDDCLGLFRKHLHVGKDSVAVPGREGKLSAAAPYADLFYHYLSHTPTMMLPSLMTAV